MPSRKRTHDEADADVVDVGAAQALQTSLAEPSLLARIRNMWQFANLAQWIFNFGMTVKIDDNLDIETLETECLKPGAPLLKEIGLRLLQFLSSHRGLNLGLFDEYTRRQYLSKAPHLNPFGDGEVAASFDDFDVFTKIKILQQMTIFAMMYSDKLREKTDETDQTQWRIEPFGWDSDDRTYFVLDDNRLYRQTDAPPPQPPKSKARPSKKTKAGRASLRATKRRRTTTGSYEDDTTVHDDDGGGSQEGREPEDNGLGGKRWECVAVDLDQLREFLGKLRKTRDENEKTLRDTVEEHLLPVLEKQETWMKRRAQARERELASMAKMANAKRSSRIAGRLEQQKAHEQAQKEERKRITAQVTAKKEADNERKLEREWEERMRSRGNRLQERRARRVRHEEELAQLSEGGRSGSEGHVSERRLESDIARRKQALEEFASEEDADWIFDCECGVYGQIDDGSHSIACERCNVWQHSACLQVSQEEADSPDFHFVCSGCQRREKEAGKEAGKPRTTIKLKINNRRRRSIDSSKARDGQVALPIVVEMPARATTPSASTGLVDDGGRIGSRATNVGAEATSQANGNSFTRNATLLPPPPAAEQSNQPVIPVKKPGRPSFGKQLPRPKLGDSNIINSNINNNNNNSQTPSSRPTVNPLSSSPPMRLTPAGVSSPQPGARRISSGRRSLSPTLAATPSAAGRGGNADSRGFPPSTPIMGGSSPNGSFAMATLPPSEHGISPTKHSPPPRPHSSHGSTNGGSFSSNSGVYEARIRTQSPIIPPTTTLVPSPPPQIMTPPHKQATGMVRR